MRLIGWIGGFFVLTLTIAQMAETELDVSAYAGASLQTANPLQPTLSGVEDAPVANAGPDRTVSEGSVVMLNGTGSSDPEGAPLTLAWAQTAGPAVTLSDPTSPTPSLQAPFVSADTVLTFQLVVSNGTLDSAPDAVNVTVWNLGASLFGVVTANGQPVAGAEVRLFRDRPLFRRQPPMHTTTNGAGFYAFTGLHRGVYWAQVVQPGFRSILQPVRVSADQDRRFDVSLR